jgi:hypothetical protein
MVSDRVNVAEDDKANLTCAEEIEEEADEGNIIGYLSCNISN